MGTIEFHVFILRDVGFSLTTPGVVVALHQSGVCVCEVWRSLDVLANARWFTLHQRSVHSRDAHEFKHQIRSGQKFIPQFGGAAARQCLCSSKCALMFRWVLVNHDLAWVGSRDSAFQCSVGDGVF